MPTPRRSSPMSRPSHFFSLSPALGSKDSRVRSYLRDNSVIFLLRSWQHALAGQGDWNLPKKKDSEE